MRGIKKVSEDIYWVGGSNKTAKLIDSIFPMKRGIAYNSYLILDDKTALIDTVDFSLSSEFVDNIQNALGGRNLDYLFLNHMEPDYYENIHKLITKYPEMQVVANEKTFCTLSQFYHIDLDGRKCIVGENDAILLGKHIVEFCMSPMVH